MAFTIGRGGAARRVGLFAATSTICWAGFVAVGGAAYASTSDNAHANGGNSAAVHDNGHGNDDAKSSSSSDSSDHSSGTAGTSGDPSQPQPPRNADQNGGGANGQCPGGAYCSTRDGSPSGNGSGIGKATGKPCAGCVGKADNKNPKGQRPNGSDHNAGYECDRNHGIGQTNPAHTGCTTGSSTPPPDCSGESTAPSDDCTPPPDCDSTPPVGADCDGSPPGGPPSDPKCTNGAKMINGACVSGLHLTRQPPAVEQASADAAGVSVLGVSASKASLPFTGSPLGLLFDVSVAALLVGTGLASLGRRRRTAWTK
jgi:hypothetical protein